MTTTFDKTLPGLGPARLVNPSAASHKLAGASAALARYRWLRARLLARSGRALIEIDEALHARPPAPGQLELALVELVTHPCPTAALLLERWRPPARLEALHQVCLILRRERLG